MKNETSIKVPKKYEELVKEVQAVVAEPYRYRVSLERGYIGEFRGIKHHGRLFRTKKDVLSFIRSARRKEGKRWASYGG